MTAGVLLGPMILTGALVLAGPLEGFAVPDLLGQTAFALIGLQVGLRFTPETVRLLGRLTGPVLLAIAALLVASFGLAVLLDATTSATLLDAYLATTPGGLYAVLAVAFGAGADTTFIVAVQTLRVVAMVLLAPLAVRWMLRARGAGLARPRRRRAPAISFAARTTRGMSPRSAGARPASSRPTAIPRPRCARLIGAAAWVSLPSDATRLAEETSVGSPWPRQYGVRCSSSLTSDGKRVDGIDLVGRELLLAGPEQPDVDERPQPALLALPDADRRARHVEPAQRPLGRRREDRQRGARGAMPARSLLHRRASLPDRPDRRMSAG